VEKSGLHFSDSKGLLECLYEYGNESSVYKKCGEYLDWMRRCGDMENFCGIELSG